MILNASAENGSLSSALRSMVALSFESGSMPSTDGTSSGLGR